MDKEGRVIRTRFHPFGCLLVTVLLGLQLTPRASAQQMLENGNTRVNARQLPVRSNDNDSSAAVGAPEQPRFPTATLLYDQYNHPASEPPIGIGSQNFEPAFANLNDQAADDFVLTVPRTNCITEVRVLGEYSVAGGPASSFNVYFYTNGVGNLPGTLLAAFMNLSYSGTPPDFVIPLPGPSSFCVTAGTYWISVEARQDFDPNGQWFWHNRTVQSNSAGAWQNPGDGYGTGCVTWNHKNACMPDQIWPDQVFEIIGFTEGPTPTPRPIPTPRPRPTPAPRQSP